MIAKKDFKLRTGAWIKNEQKHETHHDIKKGDDISALNLKKVVVDALISEGVVELKNNKKEV